MRRISTTKRVNIQFKKHNQPSQRLISNCFSNNSLNEFIYTHVGKIGAFFMLSFSYTVGLQLTDLNGFLVGVSNSYTLGRELRSGKRTQYQTSLLKKENLQQPLALLLLPLTCAVRGVYVAI